MSALVVAFGMAAIVALVVLVAYLVRVVGWVAARERRVPLRYGRLSVAAPTLLVVAAFPVAVLAIAKAVRNGWSPDDVKNLAAALFALAAVTGFCCFCLAETWEVPFAEVAYIRATRAFSRALARCADPVPPPRDAGPVTAAEARRLVASTTVPPGSLPLLAARVQAIEAAKRKFDVVWEREHH